MNIILSKGLEIREPSVHIEANVSLLAKSMFFYIQSAGHYYVEPSFRVVQDHDDSFLLLYTESGIGYLDYAGSAYTLRAGDIFFIDCRQPYEYRTDQTNLWNMIWLRFNGGSSNGYFKQIKKYTGPVLALQPGSIIPDCLGRLITTNQSVDARSPIISSKLIVEILTELLLQSNIFDWNYADPPPNIEQIITKLQTHYNEKITLDQLAEEFFISKYHLTREFKRYTGYSPIEYHMKLKIAAAKELLQTSTYSIDEIGSEIGFSSINHFIGSFKKHEGITPLVFRKRSRSIAE
ncbi:AraC family transcriptional regulator [Paenibacillus mendelii]|uniref:Helix-turn-helix domain-containing protein n=1 Tax=Paenibacillus mendelii TaxID=206163 RepID=A0ABV6JB42_9BACL|nr:AraC family transcriptional regulator [Paenibacillus mendelii]MCQ6562903.1 AraC family transcriptional regulator [Paenibacillus mendelii]